MVVPPGAGSGIFLASSLLRRWFNRTLNVTSSPLSAANQRRLGVPDKISFGSLWLWTKSRTFQWFSSSSIKGVPRCRLIEGDCCGVWTRFPLWDPNFQLAPPALDWSSINSHAPWWPWVWPRFKPLTPSPWFLIRRRLSLSPLSHSLCHLQVYFLHHHQHQPYVGVANANTTT